MPRSLILAVFASILAASSSAQTGHGLSNFATRPPAEPLRETVHGIEMEDPYRWMEGAERADEMSAWVRAASEHTRAEIAALPGRERIAQRLQSISRAATGYRDLACAGDRIFYQRLDSDSAIPKLIVRERNGAERVLFDPAANANGPAAINNYRPSPSGRLVAFHVAEGGGEVGVMRFMNVDTGETLADRLQPIWGEFSVSWIDERTVIYTQMQDPPGEDPLQNMRVRVHRLGKPQSEDFVISAAGREVEPQELPGATDSPVSGWTLGFAGGARADFRVLVTRDENLRGASPPAWTAIAGYDDRINGGDLRGDMAYLLTTRAHPNGEVIAVDLRNPSLRDARTIVATSDKVLTNVVATRDGLYIVTLENGVNGLLFVRGARGSARRVALPFDGSLLEPVQTSDGRRLTFALTGWLQNTRYFEARGGRIAEIGVASETYAGVAAFEASNDEAVSSDGTHVPMTVLSRRNAPRDGRNPAILYAYGSYGITDTPSYSPNVFAWLEEGGVFAFCHTRGGGARGRAWHEGGRERNKPNAHADYIACAERLIELGLTRPARLGATGVSAGGLLVPVAALKRPDLFAAVVPRVAIVNPTRLGVAENGPNQFAEMGDANTDDGMRALYEQDAYHWLARASASPDWMLTIGLNDRRVAPWMSAKFAARALTRFGDKHLVLVRTDPEAGHGVGSTRDQVVEERADIYAFFLNRFGVPDF